MELCKHTPFLIPSELYLDKYSRDSLKYIQIVYSHSSYSDILQVQNDYFKNINGPKYLFIDKIEENIIYNFDKILFYNDNFNYSKRILQCLKEANIEEEFIIFHLDINIVIKQNEQEINNLINIMEINYIDRLDFCTYKFQESEKNISYKDYLLIHNNDINYHIYNVGTAIYKLNKYIIFLEKFDYSYRSIEVIPEVQEYAKNNFNAYYLNYKNQKNINTGYFGMTDNLIYLHITHAGHLMPIDNNKNNLDKDLQEVYNSIVNKYKFNRNFRNSMH
jgi:hypothetical protein